MTSHELLELRRALSGPLWNYLVKTRFGPEARLRDLDEAAAILPDSPTASAMRERALIRAVIYKELFDTLPDEIDSLLKEQQAKETQS